MAEVRDVAHRFGPPIDVRPLFAKERSALMGLVATLSARDWARPTACPGWSVLDVTVHLLGDDLGRLSRSRDGYRGTEPGPTESMLTYINRLNDEWVVAGRRLSPEVVVGLLGLTGAWVAQLWAEADLNALGEPITWVGREPAPVWLDAARDYTEYWVHQQQLREALNRPRLDSPEFLGPVVDTFLRALPNALSGNSARNDTVVSVVVDGPEGGRWSVVREPRGWVFVPGKEREADTLVVLDADTLWRLGVRGLSPEAAQARAQISGDLGLAQAVLHIVSAIV